MKLANALAQRADLQRRMAQLASRLMNNAKVQEGERPAEEPAELLAQLEEISRQLEELIRRINLTNTAVRSETGCLKMKLGIYREFLQNASDVVPRGLRTEIRIVSTVKVSQMQKQVDDMSRDLRLLEETIQSLNWTTELQE